MKVQLGILLLTSLHNIVRHSSDKIAKRKVGYNIRRYMIARAGQNLNLNRCYCMTTVDLKLLRRNLLPCLQEVTSSLRLFMVARSGLQMIKHFSHKHKLQRFEAGLKGAACFKIFQVILNSNLVSFKCQN